MPRPILARSPALALLAAALVATLALTPARAQDDGPVIIDEDALLEPGPLPEMAMGEAEAPVTIVEYASLTCPHCAAFHADVLPKLKEQYIDTGKVRFIYRDFPLDRLAAAASMLSHCLPEDRYFPFVGVLFAQRETWIVEKPVEPLKNLAKQAGLSAESFDTCLANQELLDNIVAVQDRARDEFQVRSTPTVFVNGEMVRGAQDFSEFEAVIKKHGG